MKGRNSFTHSEIESIKKLISLKEKAAPSEQKGIRQEIRKIGFYYSDFSSEKNNYTLDNFESLIRGREINVFDSNYTPKVTWAILIEENGKAKNHSDVNGPSENLKASFLPLQIQTSKY